MRIVSIVDFVFVSVSACGSDTCPANAPSPEGGTPCSVDMQRCSGPVVCMTCGGHAWDFEPTYDCTCNQGHYICAERAACSTSGPGIYLDSNCTIPSVSDGGADALLE